MSLNPDDYDDGYFYFDEHPYEFDFDGDRYTEDKMEDFEDGVQDDRDIALNTVVAVGESFTYMYDYEHEITVERVVVGEAEMKIPYCVDGEGSFLFDDEDPQEPFCLQKVNDVYNFIYSK